MNAATRAETESSLPTENPGRLLAILTVDNRTVDDLATHLHATAITYPRAVTRASHLGIEIRLPGDPCACWTCVEQESRLVEDLTGHTPFVGMIVCPTCGNKRCPKAAHHDHACTGSNEPGQPGSAYA